MNDVSITAGVVAISLSPRPRILLVLERGDSIPQRDGSVFQKPAAWGFPKGSSKGDETPMETAIRELSEETGVVLLPSDLDDDLVFSEDKLSRRPGSSVHRRVIYLVVFKDSPQLGRPIDPKIQEVRWVPLNGVPGFGRDSVGEATLSPSHAIAINDLMLRAVDRKKLNWNLVMESLLPIEAKGDEDRKRN
ncbi:MAG TPA: NUDIX hydrolase [Candidatus Paceibacterota bacterium]|nr:NUDIX hydrolase [Candidatus Paceibacterota bacterium]